MNNLKRAGYSCSSLYTVKGTLIDSSKRITDLDQKWAPGYPVGNSTSVTMTDGKWDNVVDTTVVNAAICTRFIPYTLHNATGKYYGYYSTAMNHTAASSKCVEDGGTLAITYGPEGLQVLQYYFGLYNAHWIAGTDVAVENTWVFPDGETTLFSMY